MAKFIGSPTKRTGQSMPSTRQAAKKVADKQQVILYENLGI
jgi:hypothetical protein